MVWWAIMSQPLDTLVAWGIAVALVTAGRATRSSWTSGASSTGRGSIAPAATIATRCMSPNATRRLEKDAQLMEYRCAEFAEELTYGHLRKPKP
jgi:hypothetical protein